MVRLFVRHQVADYPAWKKVYDYFDAERQTLGVTGQAVFARSKPNDITVWHDFDATRPIRSCPRPACATRSAGWYFRRAGDLGGRGGLTEWAEQGSNLRPWD